MHSQVLTLKSGFGLYLIILASTSGCILLDRNEHKQITGKYEVGWNDLVRNRNISKPINDCSGCYTILVEGYVYAVGHNDSFIIAKQHLSNDTATYFYIIDTKRNEKYGGTSGVYAALNERAFDSLQKRLNFTNISFDINYPENP